MAWEAYAAVEPFGEARWTANAKLSALVFANAHRAKGERPLGFADLPSFEVPLPGEEPPSSEPHSEGGGVAGGTDARMDRAIDALAASGARVVRH